MCSVQPAFMQNQMQYMLHSARENVYRVTINVSNWYFDRDSGRSGCSFLSNIAKSCRYHISMLSALGLTYSLAVVISNREKLTFVSCSNHTIRTVEPFRSMPRGTVLISVRKNYFNTFFCLHRLCIEPSADHGSEANQKHSVNLPPFPASCIPIRSTSFIFPPFHSS
jgi:hypothetical protein